MKEKIILVSCPIDGNDCKEHRRLINQDFSASQNYFLNKDYSRSILALKNAFYKANELQESSCLNCAKMFRHSITQSLENIHNDLNYMASGFFGNQKFQSSLMLAGNILKEMRKEE